MLDLPFKALPAPLLTGLLLHAAICALWLQPLVERRMAAKTFIPQCEASAMQANHRERHSVTREVRLQERILEQLLDHPLSRLPIIGEQIEMTRQVLEAKRLRLTRPIDHSSHCACAVALAFDAIRVPMLLHVMSVRTFVPAQLGVLPLSVAEHKQYAACGGSSL